MTDIRTENHGSIWLLYPVSRAGQEWLDENVITSDTQIAGGNAVVCEPRYVAAIVDGARADGLEVSLPKVFVS